VRKNRMTGLQVHAPRRNFLAHPGGGAGAVALAALQQSEATQANERANSAPRAKRVIWLFMPAGPVMWICLIQNRRSSSTAGNPCRRVSVR